VIRGVIALGLSGIVAPAAHADASDALHGGCRFAAIANGATGDVQTGVIGDVSVSTTGDTSVDRIGDATVRPIGATVTCWIEVNGVTAPGTTHSYGVPGGAAPVQAGADPLTFAANSWDTVTECESVTFADGTTQSGCPLWSGFTPCGLDDGGGGGSIQFPPQQTEDLLNVLVNSANSFANDCVFIPYVDPALCPVLKQLAGNYPGGLTVGPDGDVDFPDPSGLGLWTGSWYDCPPYEVN